MFRCELPKDRQRTAVISDTLYDTAFLLKDVGKPAITAAKLHLNFDIRWPDMQPFANGQGFAITHERAIGVAKIRVKRVSLNIADLFVSRGQFSLQSWIIAGFAGQTIQIFKRPT